MLNLLDVWENIGLLVKHRSIVQKQVRMTWLQLLVLIALWFVNTSQVQITFVIPDLIIFVRLLSRCHQIYPTHSTSKLLIFFKANAEVFSAHEFDLGRTSLLTHRIDTGDAKPIREPLRRYPKAHQEIIDKQVECMLEAGIIEEASSPWAANIVLVTKSDSTPRVTLDYRKINSVTYRDSYPLPRIDSCLDTLTESAYFSTLDLRSGRP